MKVLTALPRARKRSWPPQLHILLDRSRHLAPFWTDQDALCTKLLKLLDNRRPAAFVVHDGRIGPVDIDTARGEVYGPPPAGGVVLALGDLGSLNGSEHTWLQLGEALRAAGCRAVAVVPIPVELVSPTLGVVWEAIGWDHSATPSVLDPLARQDLVTRLLMLASPAVRLEPGLIRGLRLALLPEADVGIEAQVWLHPEIAHASSVAAVLQAPSQARLRETFVSEPLGVQKQALAIIRDWRFGQPDEVWFEELLGLPPAVTGLDYANDLDEARAFIDAIEAGAGPNVEGALSPGLAVWLSAVADRAPEAWKYPSFRRLAWNIKKSVEGYVPPLPPVELPGGNHEQLLELRQRSGEVLVYRHGDPRAIGSPLGLVRSTNNLLWLVPAENPADRFAFWASRIPPAWAEDWGRDEHGPWVSFGVTGTDGSKVTQRLRWCPPGSFLMGSPVDEIGRFDDEGPRHRVNFAHGFWMFATTVTRALWVTVMGELPGGHAAGPDLPATEVSWEDARTFIEALNSMLPDLELSLPSEAQWEYACRAGTDTPHHFGRKINRMQVNYDADGLVPVASLPANGWGLHEMHGNVLEWCLDHWHDSYVGAPSDGSAWLDENADSAAERVVRGGSWRGDARYVRAAFRGRFEPSYRYDLLGFRCARVQSVSSSEWEAVPADPAAGRQAER
ncbi:MAG: formylglycine-generating enzyme family protein, partial [Geminicoccaceae bacterium]